jgi:hypothetical protein
MNEAQNCFRFRHRRGAPCRSATRPSRRLIHQIGKFVSDAITLNFVAAAVKPIASRAVAACRASPSLPSCRLLAHRLGGGRRLLDEGGVLPRPSGTAACRLFVESPALRTAHPHLN